MANANSSGISKQHAEHKNVVLHLAQRRINLPLVRNLEFLLDLAKRGKIIGLVGVFDDGGRYLGDFASGTSFERPLVMANKLHQIAHELAEDTYESQL